MLPKTLACKYSKHLEREVARLPAKPVYRFRRGCTIVFSHEVSFVIHLFKPWLEQGEIPNRLEIMTSNMTKTERYSTRCNSLVVEDERSENFDVLLDYYILAHELEIVELRDEVVCIWQIMRDLSCDSSLKIAPMAAHVRAYNNLPLESTLCRLLLTDLVYEYCDSTSQSRATEREAMLRVLNNRASQGVAVLLSRMLEAQFSGRKTIRRGWEAINSIEERWSKGARAACALHGHDDTSERACTQRTLKLREMSSAELKKKAAARRSLMMLPITDVFSTHA